MAFERLKKFSTQVVGVFVPSQRAKPLETKRRDLERMLAYVDPTKLFVGGKITIPYNPSVLVSRKGLEIYDSMKQDEQVKYALSFKKDTILAPGWEVVSPGDQPEDWEVTQFVRQELERVEGGFNKILGKIMTAMDYGYSINEKVFGESEFTPSFKPQPEGPKDEKQLGAAAGASKPPFGKSKPGAKKGSKPFAEMDDEADDDEDEVQQSRPTGARDGDVGLLKGKSETKLGLKRINACRPHYFDFNCDEHGTLLSLLQKYVPGQKQMLEFAPGKFVVYTYGEEFENKYGRSDLESAYRPWWVKYNAYKWFAVMLERFGMPPLFMLYNNAAYQGNQLDELKSVIKNLQNATMAMIPRAQETDLEFWTPELGAQVKSVFIEALQRCDQDIARALLIPSMIGVTPDQGSGNSGSRARSEKHFDGFMNTIKRAQDDIATNAVQPQVIVPLCDLNFPGLKSYPKFRFMPFKDEKRHERMAVWQAMVEGKVVNRIEDDERHIREVFEMPENDNPVIEELASDELNRAKAEATLNPPVPPVDPNKEAALKAKPKPKPPKKLSDDQLTVEMVEFAASNDGEWFDVDGQVVCLSSDDAAEFADEDGVWRTINGRKVFIKKGESATDAINRSLGRDDEGSSSKGRVTVQPSVEEGEWEWAVETEHPMKGTKDSEIIPQRDALRKHFREKYKRDVHIYERDRFSGKGRFVVTHASGISANKEDAEHEGAKALDEGKERGFLKAFAWDESKHPRHPSGSSQGGEFAPKFSRREVEGLKDVEVENPKRLPEEEYTIIDKPSAGSYPGLDVEVLVHGGPGEKSRLKGVGKITKASHGVNTIYTVRYADGSEESAGWKHVRQIAYRKEWEAKGFDWESVRNMYGESLKKRK